MSQTGIPIVVVTSNEDNVESILGLDNATVTELISRNVQIKSVIVEKDAQEQIGLRILLNFGHTIAHALESVSGFELLHGEAVGLGMLAAASLGTELGITEPSTSQRLTTALGLLDLPTRLPSSVDPERMLVAMTHDKKNRGGSVRFALLKNIGQAAPGPGGRWTHTAPDSILRSVLARLM